MRMNSLDTESSEYWVDRINEEGSENRLSYLKEQSCISDELKKKNEYTVIVTNPPYNGSSNRSLKSLAGRFDLTAELLKELDKDDRIRDDYVWFMAAVEHYIDENGIIALVTNDSYTNKRSYQVLRSYIARNYNIHELYLFGEGMFDDVKVATSVILMSKFKNPEVMKDIKSSIDVFDMREWRSNVNDRDTDDRYKFLNGEKKCVPYQIIPTESNGFSFTSENEMFDFVPITGRGKKLEAAILDKESGVVSGIKELFFSLEEKNLINQIGELFEIASYASVLYGSEIPEKITNDTVRNLGTKLLESSKYEEVREMVDNFSSEWKIGLQGAKGQAKRPMYVCFCVASIVLYRMEYDVRRVEDCVTLSRDSKWSFEGAEKGFIYLDNRFVIPRVNMRSGSKITGGPTTAWRKDHDKSPKLYFTTPSGSKGCSRMIISDALYNPVIFKAVSRGGAEAHYVPLERLKVPDKFESIFSNNLEYAYYLQGIINSEWVEQHQDFVVSNKVPIPLPRNSTVESILSISRMTKYINEMTKFDLSIAPISRITKKFINDSLSEGLASSLIEACGGILNKKVVIEKISTMLTASERELNSTVDSLMIMHMSADKVEPTANKKVV